MIVLGGAVLIETLVIVALVLGVSFAAVMFIQQRRLERSFRQKWGVPKSEGANVILRVTEGLIGEGKDWNTVELAAQRIMSDLWMLKGEQRKVLAIVRKVWERNPNMRALFTPESVMKIVDEMRAKIGDLDAPETKEVLDQMEKLAREAYLNAKPIPFGKIDAMRARLAEIEARQGDETDPKVR